MLRKIGFFLFFNVSNEVSKKGRLFKILKKDNFRYAEKCLYEYKRNLACLEVLRQDLQMLKVSSDVHAQSYDSTIGKNSLPSDPVLSRLLKIETVEHRIKQLERLTKPIERFEVDLKSPEVLENSRKKDLLQILNLFYFGGNSVDLVTEKLGLSRRLFFYKRRELVLEVIDYLGF